LQLRVAALCALVQICDGYDLNAVAWAVPSLIRAWHLPPAAFTIAFLWSSIGILVGALSAGPIGDRFGRRPLLLASLTIFGLARCSAPRRIRSARSVCGGSSPVSASAVDFPAQQRSPATMRRSACARR
jgi:MFS family permease